MKSLFALALAAVSVCANAAAQTPVTAADGRLTLSGQASASVGSDDTGYFNYSSYDYALLRLVRLDGTADLRVTDAVSLLGDLRVLASTDAGHWLVRPYAAFVRVRPWADRTVDIQAGLIPPVFGVFSRRGYDSDNPLIGYPLAYQYLTSLRGNALPATLDDLLEMRGRGWLTRYPVGEPAAEAGVPLIDGVRYQSGIEVHAGDLRPVEAAVAWTAGALSTPGLQRGNAGRQLSGRAAVQPVTGLIAGVSASRGEFVAAGVRAPLAALGGGDQRAVGFDAEYSRGHYLLRSEGVYSNWRVPLAGAGTRVSLSAFAVDVEARYRITPRVYAAGRLDRLTFGNVSAAGGATPWDYPVQRLQLGAGVFIARHALLKVEWQRNRRDLGDVGATPYGGASIAGGYQTLHLFSAQVVAWF